MVPSVCSPHRDEAAIHLAYLPVHRIFWRTGTDKGEKLPEIFQWSSLCYCQTCSLLVCLDLCSFIISSATSWTISHRQAMNVRVLHRFRVWIHYPFFINFLQIKESKSKLSSFRKFDLAHLQRERGLSGHWVGEVLLLQEHRSARDLLRTSSYLPSDSGAGGRAGGGLQEQESRCTAKQY